MKYNKYWKQALATDQVFQCKSAARCVLSYDKWKQRCKEASTLDRLNWQLYLTRECRKIDARIFEPFPLWCTSHMLSNDEKLKICELNKKTLYKICKKVDKVLLKGDKAVGMHWYTAMCAGHCFRFLGCAELARLRLTDDTDCPICWEPIVQRDPVVVRCGHAFCAGCASRMWLKHGDNETGNPMTQPCGHSVSRELRKAVGAACPICRFPVA